MAGGGWWWWCARGMNQVIVKSRQGGVRWVGNEEALGKVVVGGWGVYVVWWVWWLWWL